MSLEEKTEEIEIFRKKGATPNKWHICMGYKNAHYVAYCGYCLKSRFLGINYNTTKDLANITSLCQNCEKIVRGRT